MPLLLEALAEETSASNMRTAERLEAETRELEHLLTLVAVEVVRQRSADSARQATDHVLARMSLAEGVWRSALDAMPKGSNDACVRLLRHLVEVFESGQRLAQLSRAMWTIASTLEIPPEHRDELERVERRFEQLTHEARASLEHRTKGWQPADPERFARGLQAAREGKAVQSDEANAWVRRPLE